ncbi:MAG: rhamnose:proton symporter [Pirellulales bacterium]|nr:rhamnose:proton symporter [Pirellulales bacterium]
MITPHPLLGTFLHSIGALSSSVCYAPQKKVKGWSWQTYWIVQAAFCWFLLPILGAILTIPQLGTVLGEAPKDAMAISFLLGMIYGVGGTAFGVSIRYIGFSLTYAIAVGLSSVVGTLLPPFIDHRFDSFLHDLLWEGVWTPPFDSMELAKLFHRTGSDWVLLGVLVSTAGIGICGLAGRLKEKQLQGAGAPTDFRLGKGLALAILAGFLSAVYGFSLNKGKPIADLAELYGAGIWKGNVVYIFSNTGAFVTTAIYCMYLHFKHRTLGELVELPAGEERSRLPMNFGMAVLTGVLWYGQFFFYNLGHVRMGSFEYTSWAIHMTMLVLFSNAIALAFGEWKGCRRITHATILLALTVLVSAVMLLTYGNYLGDKSGESKKKQDATAAKQKFSE